MDRFLTWFIRGWFALAALINILSIAGLLLTAKSAWDGWQRIAEIYNPLNFYNLIMEAILFSPAIIAYIWRERRQGTRS